MTKCPCGRPLHYTDPEHYALISAMVTTLGATVEVEVAGLGRWKVPRHFIALHGFLGADLPELAIIYGFDKVT